VCATSVAEPSLSRDRFDEGIYSTQYQSGSFINVGSGFHCLLFPTLFLWLLFLIRLRGQWFLTACVFFLFFGSFSLVDVGIGSSLPA